jgi:hypothetical protein
VPRAASFEVAGDAVRVVLAGASGRFEAGPVPAGSYTIEATFADGTPVIAGNAVVAGTQRIRVTCSSMFARCESTAAGD